MEQKAKLRLGTLVKLSDDKFDGKHPNNIKAGYTTTGPVYVPPTAGESCVVNTLWTSTVVTVFEEKGNVVKFTTLNSTYELTYNDLN